MLERMKHIAILAAVLAVTPALASAQQAPPLPARPGSSAAQGMPPDMAAMRQMHAQMEQLHQQARSQILGALTPQHRTMVANIMGQLAVASTPNLSAAAAQIDAALSSGEKQAVLSVHTNMVNSMRGMMSAQRPGGDAAVQKRAGTGRMADPGMIVLRMLGHGGPMHEGAR